MDLKWQWTWTFLKFIGWILHLHWIEKNYTFFIHFAHICNIIVCDVQAGLYICMYYLFVTKILKNSLNSTRSVACPCFCMMRRYFWECNTSLVLKIKSKTLPIFLWEYSCWTIRKNYCPELSSCVISFLQI